MGKFLMKEESGSGAGLPDMTHGGCPGLPAFPFSVKAGHLKFPHKFIFKVFSVSYLSHLP